MGTSLGWRKEHLVSTKNASWKYIQFSLLLALASTKSDWYGERFPPLVVTLWHKHLHGFVSSWIKHSPVWSHSYPGPNRCFVLIPFFNCRGHAVILMSILRNCQSSTGQFTTFPSAEEVVPAFAVHNQCDIRMNALCFDCKTEELGSAKSTHKKMLSLYHYMAGEIRVHKNNLRLAPSLVIFDFFAIVSQYRTSKRYLLWKLHKKFKRKTWSNVPPNLLAVFPKLTLASFPLHWRSAVSSCGNQTNLSFPKHTPANRSNHFSTNDYQFGTHSLQLFRTFHVNGLEP